MITETQRTPLYNAETGELGGFDEYTVTRPLTNKELEHKISELCDVITEIIAACSCDDIRYDTCVDRLVSKIDKVKENLE